MRDFVRRHSLLRDLMTAERVRRWLEGNGYGLAAEMLGHYLSRDGSPVSVPLERLRQSQAFRDAESLLLQRVGLKVLCTAVEMLRDGDSERRITDLVGTEGNSRSPERHTNFSILMTTSRRR